MFPVELRGWRELPKRGKDAEAPLRSAGLERCYPMTLRLVARADRYHGGMFGQRVTYAGLRRIATLTIKRPLPPPTHTAGAMEGVSG